MLNCVYHPVDAMRVVSDEERNDLLSTGVWFDSPTEAKQLRNTYERRIQQDEKPRKRASKRKTKDDAEGSSEPQRFCEETTSDGSSDEREST